jgi:hypothetical protein
MAIDPKTFHPKYFPGVPINEWNSSYLVFEFAAAILSTEEPGIPSVAFAEQVIAVRFWPRIGGIQSGPKKQFGIQGSRIGISNPESNLS